MSNKLSLRQIRDTEIFRIYGKLLKQERLTDSEIRCIYHLAIIFINRGNYDVRNFGYKLLLKTAFHEGNLRPIYDVSINLGYYPVTEFISRQYHDTNDFIKIMNASFLENFKIDSIYLTEQQNEMISQFKENYDKTVAVIAPTSYGKSELITNLVFDNRDMNICILVPTKALLSQTKKRILRSRDFPLERKIITHPDMYQSSDTNFIAILTQERLMRLLEKEPQLAFDIAIIDEAHNLFDNDNRNKLLGVSIALLFYRNNLTRFKFLSPFLIDTNNLMVRFCEYEINEQRISENIKINNYYTVDVLKDLKISAYDQFLNRFVKIGAVDRDSEIDFILKYSGRKNLVYLNYPPKLEEVAKILADKNHELHSPKIQKACDEISNYLHGDYNLIYCLKRGVVYHHGTVPDIVKLYIEDLYTKEKELKYMVCSSTLLEGVNIPAEKLFLLEYRKGKSRLTASQFKNLSGRVCRFSELFSKNNKNLELLEPDIYVIKSKYSGKRANIQKFLQDTVKEDKKISDNPQNVLLKNTKLSDDNIEEYNSEREFLGNFEPGIVESSEIRIAQTEIGKLCFKNSIKELDIIENEIELQEIVNIKRKSEKKATNPKEVINMIRLIFLDFINDENENRNLLRLKEDSAVDFYAMFLSWLMRGAPFSELIRRFLSYWQRLSKNDSHDGLVYVGRWGDLTRGGHRSLWVNIREKSEVEKVNLAILRIKEEQDFVENKIVKFIEVLNDLELVEEDIYKRIKYGTSDPIAIIMIKNGYSNSLAKLLLSKYRDYLEVNIEKSIVITNPAIINQMEKNGENDLYIFETKFNIKTTDG